VVFKPSGNHWQTDSRRRGEKEKGIKFCRKWERINRKEKNGRGLKRLQRKKQMLNIKVLANAKHKKILKTFSGLNRTTAG